ncbi:hypothetical protein [Sphingomonas sp. Leaf343]|uniref:hypothetical protein n=1 Tax=Sphingomonas sp. Leaf343 TaxID=1736345 RepID=UPI0006FA6573|nr:hypothetical protein [Sphingomonas sp. Leaf343]KQR80805.1 hypothetical protein ASG07_13485 [Sphingomonas sp. Leaf343]
MLFDVLVMAYAVVVAFVLSTASRNRREQRPNGQAVLYAGQLACGVSMTFAVLCMGWVGLSLMGAAPYPTIS